MKKYVIFTDGENEVPVQEEDIHLLLHKEENKYDWNSFPVYPCDACKRGNKKDCKCDKWKQWFGDAWRQVQSEVRGE